VDIWLVRSKGRLVPSGAIDRAAARTNASAQDFSMKFAQPFSRYRLSLANLQ
jgi:hypothetical protein